MSKRLSYRLREAQQKVVRAFTFGNETLVADALDLKRQLDAERCSETLTAPDRDLPEPPRAAPMPRTRRVRVVFPARESKWKAFKPKGQKQ